MGWRFHKESFPLSCRGLGGRGGGVFLRDESFSCHGRCFKGVERKKEKKLF